MVSASLPRRLRGSWLNNTLEILAGEPVLRIKAESFPELLNRVTDASQLRQCNTEVEMSRREARIDANHFRELHLGVLGIILHGQFDAQQITCFPEICVQANRMFETFDRFRSLLLRRQGVGQLKMRECVFRLELNVPDKMRHCIRRVQAHGLRVIFCCFEQVSGFREQIAQMELNQIGVRLRLQRL